MKSRFAAGAFREGDVECLNFAKGEFKVKSSSNSKLFYNVDLQVLGARVKPGLSVIFRASIFLLYSIHSMNVVSTHFLSPTRIACSSHLM